METVVNKPPITVQYGEQRMIDCLIYGQKFFGGVLARRVSQRLL
jgi:hypothetical protein